MNKEEIKERALAITNPAFQANELYELLDAIGIKYKKSNCHKCRADLYNILLEELNIIEDASAISSFDSECEYKYIRKQTVLWNRDGKYIKINQNTPIEIIKEFIKTHPGYFVCK